MSDSSNNPFGSMVFDSSGVNAPLVDQAGNHLVNIPAWQTATLYPQGYVVQQGGVVYMATTTFTSGASFGADGANWAPLSSAELAYAERTSNFTTTATVNTDVTGLSISVTTNGRPFVVKFDGGVQNSLAAGTTQAFIVRTSDSTTVWARYFGSGSANEITNGHGEVRQSLAAGTYTYKFQIASTSGSNTSTVTPGNAGSVFLQAMQI